jgi:hypothetical protein
MNNEQGQSWTTRTLRLRPAQSINICSGISVFFSDVQAPPDLSSIQEILQLSLTIQETTKMKEAKSGIALQWQDDKKEKHDQ